MSELDRYTQLKTQQTRAKESATRAEGAIGELMKQLKEQFDCDTLKDAKAKYRTLKESEVQLEEELKAALDIYTEKWDGQDV